MINKKTNTIKIGDAQRRWMHVGPYYAMFPLPHVSRIITEHTQPGDAVLDPFAGRFSVPALAGYLDRVGCGIEISPLGWLYGRVKMNPAQRSEHVLRRLEEMASIRNKYSSEAANANEFFRMCYHPDVLCFLLACRNELNWKHSVIDATLMAQILISLHHGIGSGLSNQMRQAKAMAPRYSVNWWKQHEMERPPQVDPVSFLQKRILWRYMKGIFKDHDGKAFLGDSCKILPSNAKKWAENNGGVKLLFTSPPYWSLVNYFKDQWLRLWMLGGQPSPAAHQHAFKKNFSAKNEYCQLIRTVFTESEKLMRDDGIVVVRMDTRDFTRKTILDTLQECFPAHRIYREAITANEKSQTALFNNFSNDSEERDIVLVPN